MKLISIVKTYGEIEGKPYESYKLVATETFEKNGVETCKLFVGKCSGDFRLPVGTEFEPVFDRFGKVVGKRG